MTAKASGEIQEDNRRTRVTLWRFPPHGETGFHRHELDYVIVPLTSGPLTIVDKQGQETTAELTAGVSYRSEEHTSELQSLMRISYAVFCLKKKKKNIDNKYNKPIIHHTYQDN